MLTSSLGLTNTSQIWDLINNHFYINSLDKQHKSPLSMCVDQFKVSQFWGANRPTENSEDWILTVSEPGYA